MEYIIQFGLDFIGILNDMSPYLLLGFLFAGILHVFFPKDKINKYLGQRNTSSVINASILGVPLPLCSCGVIPTGISFYKNGASKGSSVSFLTSTPQTGIDSILVTYSLLGLPFAIIRPIVAFITGIAGGIFANIFDNEKREIVKTDIDDFVNVDKKGNVIYRTFKYAFFDFLDDIAKWLVVGILIAAIISVVIPDDFFTSSFTNEFASMLIILLASIPVYVCATASVPIAAILMLKGLSPGAALVLLMAGPATNAATITLIGKTFGRKTLVVYMTTIIVGALVFGFIINTILPANWFLIPGQHGEHIHNHELLPYWLKIGSSLLLGSLIINSLVKTFFEKRKLKKMKKIKINVETMVNKEVIINGMTCNHCKMTVEKGLMEIGGIERVEADIYNSHVKISGEHIDLEEVKNAALRLGYQFAGEVD